MSPTPGLRISGDTTEIPGIRYIASYAPVVGDTVLVIKQGTDLVALGEIAGQFSDSTWTTATLGAGLLPQRQQQRQRALPQGLGQRLL